MKILKNKKLMVIICITIIAIITFASMMFIKNSKENSEENLPSEPSSGVVMDLRESDAITDSDKPISEPDDNSVVESPMPDIENINPIEAP